MERRFAGLFFALEGILYAAFLAGDIADWPYTAPLKFCAIILVALCGLKAGRSKENRAVTAALLLTVLADVFLLVLNRHYAVGIALFLAVQLLYAVRLARSAGSRPWRGVLLRGALALAAGTALVKFGPVAALSGAYICCFAVNLAQAVGQAAHAPERKRTLFAVGLALFFLCDLCVGANNLPAAMLPVWIPGFVRVAMWGFYLPGQVLILLSTGVFEEEKR
ncbi:MAG: hypothetical protein HFF09_05615 [Oscillospiraceae bacterium]|nr:hypothetical protein [Oscillospiraceae bacterium]